MVPFPSDEPPFWTTYYCHHENHVSIKTLMKNIHQNVIKYLTYLVLNTRKLENEQFPVSPRHKRKLYWHLSFSPPPKRDITPNTTSRQPWLILGQRAHIHAGTHVHALSFILFIYCHHVLPAAPIARFISHNPSVILILPHCGNLAHAKAM